ncbi:hypothetical protein B0H19DRAFT_1066865 [Mycena capillaripes]|nr:hypothetical protein B0H19DRAFT_1066865 [Mycena capillaripes]
MTTAEERASIPAAYPVPRRVQQATGEGSTSWSKSHEGNAENIQQLSSKVLSVAGQSKSIAVVRVDFNEVILKAIMEAIMELSKRGRITENRNGLRIVEACRSSSRGDSTCNSRQHPCVMPAKKALLKRAAASADKAVMPADIVAAEALEEEAKPAKKKLRIFLKYKGVKVPEACGESLSQARWSKLEAILGDSHTIVMGINSRITFKIAVRIAQLSTLSAPNAASVGRRIFVQAEPEPSAFILL